MSAGRGVGAAEGSRRGGRRDVMGGGVTFWGLHKGRRRIRAKVGLNVPVHFFSLFWFNFKYPQSILNERIFEKI